MTDFNNRLFVVTGAASGIGAAVVTAAAEAGADVVGLDIQDAADRPPESGLKVRHQHCDVSQIEGWQHVADLFRDQTGPSFLHLNAGIQIAPPEAPLADYQLEAMTIERYRRMMGVNVDGVVFGLQAVLPLLLPGSAVVVTGSLAGITPYSIDPLYAMSKHAVTGLVRSLAPTLVSRQVRLNAICPGGIDTAIIPDVQRTENAVLMTPDKVAEDVMWLMAVEETGKTWAKVSEEKPPFIVRAPGDKKG